MSELIAITGKAGLPLIAASHKLLRSFQPTAAIHFQRYIHGANGNAPVIQHDSTVILDARAFEGGGDGIPKMRDYIQDIRKKHANGSNPHILCLRFDTHDASIEKNDMRAGATATLFYMGNIPDATRRMNTFIETGKLPSPRQGRTVTMANIPSLFLHGTDGIDEDDGINRIDEPVSKKSLSKAPSESRVIRAKSSVTKPKVTPVLVPKESMPIIPPVTPIPTTENDLGEEDMSTLLTALETLIRQNAQILAALENIRDGVNGLRTEKEGALLAQAQEKVIVTVESVLAQLRGNGEARPTVMTTSTDAIASPTTTITPSAETKEVPVSMPEKDPPIATLAKGKPFMTDVSLFGKTISLRHLSADLFAHLVNTGETLGSADVASMYEIGYQGSYSRIRNLLDDLDAFRKGLSSCLICVQSGNSKRYRFDIDAFRKAFNIK